MSMYIHGQQALKAGAPVREGKQSVPAGDVPHTPAEQTVVELIKKAAFDGAHPPIPLSIVKAMVKNPGRLDLSMLTELQCNTLLIFANIGGTLCDLARQEAGAPYSIITCGARPVTGHRAAAELAENARENIVDIRISTPPTQYGVAEFNLGATITAVAAIPGAKRPTITLCSNHPCRLLEIVVQAHSAPPKEVQIRLGEGVICQSVRAKWGGGDEESCELDLPDHSAQLKPSIFWVPSEREGGHPVPRLDSFKDALLAEIEVSGSDAEQLNAVRFIAGGYQDADCCAYDHEYYASPVFEPPHKYADHACAIALLQQAEKDALGHHHPASVFSCKEALSLYSFLSSSRFGNEKRSQELWNALTNLAHMVALSAREKYLVTEFFTSRQIVDLSRCRGREELLKALANNRLCLVAATVIELAQARPTAPAKPGEPPMEAAAAAAASVGAMGSSRPLPGSDSGRGGGKPIPSNSSSSASSSSSSASSSISGSSPSGPLPDSKADSKRRGDRRIGSPVGRAPHASEEAGAYAKGGAASVPKGAKAAKASPLAKGSVQALAPAPTPAQAALDKLLAGTGLSSARIAECLTVAGSLELTKLDSQELLVLQQIPAATWKAIDALAASITNSPIKRVHLPKNVFQWSLGPLVLNAAAALQLDAFSYPADAAHNGTSSTSLAFFGALLNSDITHRPRVELRFDGPCDASKLEVVLYDEEQAAELAIVVQRSQHLDDRTIISAKVLNQEDDSQLDLCYTDGSRVAPGARKDGKLEARAPDKPVAQPTPGSSSSSASNSSSSASSAVSGSSASGSVSAIEGKAGVPRDADDEDLLIAAAAAKELLRPATAAALIEKNLPIKQRLLGDLNREFGRLFLSPEWQLLGDPTVGRVGAVANDPLQHQQYIKTVRQYPRYRSVDNTALMLLQHAEMEALGHARSANSTELLNEIVNVHGLTIDRPYGDLSPTAIKRSNALITMAAGGALSGEQRSILREFFESQRRRDISGGATESEYICSLAHNRLAAVAPEMIRLVETYPDVGSQEGKSSSPGQAAAAAAGFTGLGSADRKVSPARRPELASSPSGGRIAVPASSSQSPVPRRNAESRSRSAPSGDPSPLRAPSASMSASIERGQAESDPPSVLEEVAPGAVMTLETAKGMAEWITSSRLIKYSQDSISKLLSVLLGSSSNDDRLMGLDVVMILSSVAEHRNTHQRQIADCWKAFGIPLGPDGSPTPAGHRLANLLVDGGSPEELAAAEVAVAAEKAQASLGALRASPAALPTQRPDAGIARGRSPAPRAQKVVRFARSKSASTPRVAVSGKPDQKALPGAPTFSSRAEFQTWVSAQLNEVGPGAGITVQVGKQGITYDFFIRNIGIGLYNITVTAGGRQVHAASGAAEKLGEIYDHLR